MPRKYILTGKALAGRNQQIWDLFLEDWTQQEIAAELGISNQRVSQVIREWAAQQDELPRDVSMRARRAQVDAHISYWATIATDEDRTLKDRIAADKRVGFWADFRARLNAEYAPASVWIGGQGAEDRPHVTVVIEDEIRKALS